MSTSGGKGKASSPLYAVSQRKKSFLYMTDDIYPFVSRQIPKGKLKLPGVSAVTAVVQGNAPPPPRFTLTRLYCPAKAGIGPGLDKADKSRGGVHPAGKDPSVEGGIFSLQQGGNFQYALPTKPLDTLKLPA